MIAVLNAAMAAFYYLRVVVYMYMQEPAADAQPVTDSRPMRLGLLIAALATVLIGLIPGLLIPMAQAAAAAIQ